MARRDGNPPAQPSKADHTRYIGHHCRRGRGAPRRRELFRMAWFRRGPAPQDVDAVPVFSSEESRRVLRDLRGVGPSKPLGMLPVEVIHACGETPERLATEAEGRGLYVHQTADADRRDSAPRPDRRANLYVADRAALEAVLARHESTLAAAGWPSTGEAYVGRVASELVQADTPLFDVVADSFADYANPGRTDCVDRRSDAVERAVYNVTPGERVTHGMGEEARPMVQGVSAAQEQFAVHAEPDYGFGDANEFGQFGGRGVGSGFGM